MSGQPWSVRLRLDEVPETGRHVDITADEATRAAVAKAANVDAVEALSASFDLTRRGRDGLRAIGTVRATIRQLCVVSLEPVTNTVAEPIEVTFAPPLEAGPAGSEVDVAATDDDETEPLLNGAVDLAAVATEFLILGIDPYPRKEGVAFTPPAAATDPAENPFAALAALKNTSKVKD